jgi:hypothetical protein
MNIMKKLKAMFCKKIISLLLVITCSYPHRLFAQTNSIHSYEINANVPPVPISSDHLKMGGTNLKGETIAVNNYYFSINGKPAIPVTGEFHFSRYPEAYWEESIKKMKAGGINMIASYIFWSMHEEKEGKFNWTGNRNLRHFVQLCAQNNMKVIMRIGPFGHGEIRNGGIPDWMLGKPAVIRSDDSTYLYYVNRLYTEIGKQLNGLYFKDGGPIIAVQLENEYQHSASPWGLTYPGQPYDFTVADRDLEATHEGVSIATDRNQYADQGNEHMRTLKRLAQKAGIDVPIYTATGWGYAALIPGETIPVTAAYAYPTWTDKKDISPFYLYKDMHRHPDYAPVRYKPEDYPVFAAELGSGIMSTYSRRPVVPPNSMDALINRCLGSGANGIGYYMYHGGSTPKGEFFFNDEAYGYPKISYDFQAPIGEYGQVRPAFHQLKLLHFFLNDFSEWLAPMQTILPPGSENTKPENTTDLRFAIRSNGHSGFLFLNNFQDDTVMADKNGLQIKIKTSGETINIPEASTFNLKNEEQAIFPFNFDLNGTNLNYATAQLVTRGSDSEPYYVFFAPEGIHPEFSLSNTPNISINNKKNCTVEHNAVRWLVRCNGSASEFEVQQGKVRTRILVVDKTQALKSWIVQINGKRRILFADALVLPGSNGALELYSTGNNEFSISIYPKLEAPPSLSNGSIRKESNDELFSVFTVTLPKAQINMQSQMLGQKRILVFLPSVLPSGLNDVFLKIDYLGDTGMGFINGELVTDEFYKGIPWQIGLKRFIGAASRSMLFYFRPMHRTAPYLVDLNPSKLPDFDKTPLFNEINKVEFIPEYKSVLRFAP